MSDKLPKRRPNRTPGAIFGGLGVLWWYIVARVCPRVAVDHLVSALESVDETTSMAAYMALVKLGARNAKQLLREAKRGRATAAIIRLLGDLGDPELISALKEFEQSADEEIAGVARDSIQALQES